MTQCDSFLRGRSLALALLAGLLAPARALPVDPPVLASPRRTGGQFEFTLLGQSNSSYRIETSANLQSWSPVITNTEAGATRTIVLSAPATRASYRVARLATPFYRFALAATGEIDLNGNNLNVDSFNSADPLRSTGGLYDPAKAGDRADVAATRGLTNPPAVGSAIIAGTLRMSPNGATAIGSLGAVGDKAWLMAGNHGIQPGHLSTNLNLSLPAVAPPFSAGGFTPSGGVIGGTTYAYVLDTANYQLAVLGLSSSQKMLVRGQAVLYVQGGVTVAGTAALVIDPGASLRLYVGGANTSISLAGVQNPGRPAQLQLYGLPANTSVNLVGGPSFTGAIYAPAATLTLGSGGAGVPQFSGSFLVRSIRLSNSAAVHFDEDLAASGPAY